MTNILSIPQFPIGTSITIASNADFLDQFYVGIPSFNSAPLTIVGTLTAGSGVISNIISTAGIVPGMTIAGYGIPLDTLVAPGGVTINSITMSQFATQTFINATLVVLPPPLDLSDISFNSMIRNVATSGTVIANFSTGNGLMVNGGVDGTFGWNVPAAKMPKFIPTLTSSGSMDFVISVQATDNTGAVVDLCALNGPIPLKVNLSVTR